MSNAINHSCFTSVAVHLLGLCFLDKNAYAWTCHSTDRHPSIKACHPIEFYAVMAVCSVADVLVGDSSSSSLHDLNLVIIIDVVDGGVRLFSSISSSLSKETYHAALAESLPHFTT